jgi:DNA-binding transcriptional regulator LsrR (DeoR family)
MDKEQRYCDKLKAAQYYYNQNLTQQEIAEKLYISRPTVSKLLKEAEEDGIIQFKVVDIQNKCAMFKLEEKITNKFGLKNVILADYDENYEDLKENIGKAAAIFFEKIAKNDMKIGFSWGTTLKAMVRNLNYNNKIRNLELITLVGGSGVLSSDVHSNIIIEDVLDKYEGTGHFLYAPSIVDSVEIKNNIMKNRETKRILEKAKNVEIAFVGIGSNTELPKRLHLLDEEYEELKDLNSVGDVCSRFYDSEGNLCDSDINKRIIGIDLESLRDIETVVGVAGGLEKVESIFAALENGFLDILITDELTAKKVLEKKYNTNNSEKAQVEKENASGAERSIAN